MPCTAGAGGDRMIYNFSEVKEKNGLLEKRLRLLRKEYENREMSGEQMEKLRRRMQEANATDRKEKARARRIKIASAAAVLAGMLVLLPNTSASIAYAMEQLPVIGRLVDVITFRNYAYESDRNMADIEVPEIKTGELAQNSAVQDRMNRTTEEINAEIRKNTDQIIREFEAGLQMEDGYQDVMVTSEVLTAAEGYFTLKVLFYQGSGSGYAWNYFYTIDLNTGTRLQLRDIFLEGADYITPISESIREQMVERMAADEDAYYWVDDEIEAWNFKEITDETSFYLNEKGNVVICFNEGDVAPMYMGTVEFEIPAEVLEDIRK